MVGPCSAVMQLTPQEGEAEVTLGKSVSQPGLHIAITWERLKKNTALGFRCNCSEAWLGHLDVAKLPSWS